MQRAEQDDLGGYAQLLEHNEQVWNDLIAELTVGETYFFREPSQFTFIRDEALPAILRQRGSNHMIRTWSAGCASGEEPYSLAILLDQQGLLQQSNILATDISTLSLQEAKKAVYPDWSFRGQAASRAKPYFQRRADKNVLDDRIRRQVRFERLNLAMDSYPSIVTGTQNLDLIMCRNVLIYFDHETVKSIAQRLYSALAEGGWLITASADPQLEKLAPFAAVVRNTGVYYYRSMSVTTVPTERGFWARTTTTQPTPDSAQQSDNVRAGQPPNQHVDDWLAHAEQALNEGRYTEAVELTAARTPAQRACAIRIQALANIDGARAARACEQAIEQHPLSAHLHYLHAMVLLESNRAAEAATSARRVIYLDPDLAVAHLLLGSSLRQMGDLAGACRAFRNAYELCIAWPDDEVVRLSDGETAGSLARAADLQIQSIETVWGAAQ